MFQHSRIRPPRNQPRVTHGFTLVEMLVAIALVLLMMSLFAEIFSSATSSMSRQKGVAENDQRARMVLTLLKGDLEKRTFRDIVPFEPGMSTAIPYVSTRLPNRSGYLCYSENNPQDDTDDTLRLTIDVGRTAQNKDVTPLYGRTTVLGTLGNNNQPETDDGNFGSSDNTGMADWAEVVYFLRGGRLYRRQMLIREPYISGAISEPTTGSPPTTTPILGTTYGFGSGIFWKDFDYSAFFDPVNNRTRFHDANSLNNTSAGLSPTINFGGGLVLPVSLGIPHLRFGHTTLVASGIPKEFTGSGDSGTYIGNYTHEETSNDGASGNTPFRHPGQATTAANNPFAQTGLTLDAETQAVEQFKGGSRIGEDLLLTNVLSFDIKIWDPGVDLGQDGVAGDNANKAFNGNPAGDDDGDGIANNNIERGWPLSDDGDWRDLGHSDLQGFYSRSSGNLNGNGTNYGNRFDTWHPNGILSLPPYRALHYVPTGTTAATNQPWRVPNKGTWLSGNNYVVGDVIFSTSAAAHGHTFVYRCLSISGVGASGGTAPSPWPSNPGDTVVDNQVVWQCVENTIPVKGLQFRIRYLDISSGLVRDLTFVQYLTIPE